jgi:hypothetical protein
MGSSISSMVVAWVGVSVAQLMVCGWVVSADGGVFGVAGVAGVFAFALPVDESLG